MQDADSLDPASGEKKEGEFYVWGVEEVIDVLGECAGLHLCAVGFGGV